MTPTLDQYGDFQTAYDHFNRALFGGTLPNVLITLPRSRKYRGYYRSHGFASTAKHDTSERITTADEVAMNPESFKGRTDKAILSTLVHEMCHVQQAHFGKPSPGGYHNREWGDMMRAVGLYPSATGEPGGAETGVAMTHYIIEGGPFCRTVDELVAGGWRIRWRTPDDMPSNRVDKVSAGVAAPTDPRAKAKKASKTKFTCPTCGASAWGKPDLRITCADHNEPMTTA